MVSMEMNQNDKTQLDRGIKLSRTMQLSLMLLILHIMSQFKVTFDLTYDESELCVMSLIVDRE